MKNKAKKSQAPFAKGLLKTKKHQTQKKIDWSANIVAPDSHFSVTESYKTARTNLMFTLAGQKGCKRVMVTSAQGGEGKSTTTCNLAITLAQSDARVLVMEADLRRPKLHRYLSLANDKGMSEYLGGFAQLDEVVQHSERYNIDCITGGHIPPNPSELLISPAFGEMLEILSEKYDYIFVDSPPVNIVTDPVSIAKQMSGVILVVRQNYTTSDVLRQAVSTLEFGEIKILGYLLNGSKEVSISNKRSRYRYGYQGYSGYAYMQDEE